MSLRLFLSALAVSVQNVLHRHFELLLLLGLELRCDREKVEDGPHELRLGHLFERLAAHDLEQVDDLLPVPAVGLALRLDTSPRVPKHHVTRDGLAPPAGLPLPLSLSRSTKTGPCTVLHLSGQNLVRNELEIATAADGRRKSRGRKPAG